MSRLVTDFNDPCRRPTATRTEATRRALLREDAQFDSRLSPVHLTQPRDPQKKTTHTHQKKNTFHLHGGESAGTVSTP